jgi:DNA-binding transcriptional regulator YiaG
MTDYPYITGEEAEWTRQAMGLTRMEFAYALRVSPQCVYNWIIYPERRLRPRTAERLIALCRAHEQQPRLSRAAANPDNRKPWQRGGAA